MFKLISQYKHSGNEPEVIKEFVDVIKRKAINKSTLILAYNKTLAGQLYSKYKDLFSWHNKWHNK